jgi:hypothetical protein
MFTNKSSSEFLPFWSELALMLINVWFQLIFNIYLFGIEGIFLSINYIFFFINRIEGMFRSTT